MSKPVVEKLDFPPEYGNPTERLEWPDVERRLESATVYWMQARDPMGGHTLFRATARGSTGRSITGAALRLCTTATSLRILTSSFTSGDGQEAIIVEGTLEIEKPTEEMAARLSDMSFAKYPQYGRLEPSLYAGGVSDLRPRRVLAWTAFTENATRFKFE